LPDISELNGTAIDNVAEFDGVAVPAAVSAPAAAYSVRLLGSGVGISSYTGPAMRVRRDTAGGTGDDDEADIAFDSGVISLDSAISNASAGVTATTLGEFINVGTVGGTTYSNPDSLSGTASCFVDEWKDQSGNANDASQATFGSQPQIHSGTVNTDLITENGEPTLDFDGSNDFFRSIAVASATANTIATVLKADSTLGGLQKVFARPNSTAGQLRLSGAQYSFDDYELSPITTTRASVTTAAAQDLLFGYVTNTNKTVRLGKNGGTFDVGTTLTKDLQIIGTAETDAKLGSKRDGSAEYFNGNIQEFVLWTTDHSASRSAIESDINGFFSIF